VEPDDASDKDQGHFSRFGCMGTFLVAFGVWGAFIIARWILGPRRENVQKEGLRGLWAILLLGFCFVVALRIAKTINPKSLAGAVLIAVVLAAIGAVAGYLFFFEYCMPT
jgi:hypothetical protein